MSLLNQSWKEITADETAASSLAAAFALPPVLARVLVARGCGGTTAARRFLQPDLAHDFVPPASIPGIPEAAVLIWQAIREKKSIVAYGDYDVDGVAALAILTDALRQLGATVSAFIPDRTIDGYGLTNSGLKACIAAQGGKPPGLLITVDCGITATAETAQLNALGVTVIITDHHEPGPERPAAAAIVDPALGSFPAAAASLCGAGVAFKLVHALVERGREKGWYTGRSIAGRGLTLAGLATVTDIVPLVGENRLLVAAALRRWRTDAGLGLQALLARAAAKAVDRPTVHTFGFLLGPRLNAAGRMASAQLAYELLTTTDPNRAAELAVKLEGLNAERRTVEVRITEAASLQCGFGALSPAAPTQQPCALVASGEVAEGWHPGVLGIVAARLMRNSDLPAAVVAFGADGMGKGSIRAPEGYDVMAALETAQPALVGFGGHAQAAGFSVRRERLADFTQRFGEACRCQREHFAAPELEFDGWLEPAAITPEFFAQQERLAPFGNGNRSLRWGLRHVTLKNVRIIGGHGDHLQLEFALPDGTSRRGVWFGQGHLAESIRKLACCDIVFQLVDNEFNHQHSLEFQLLDLAPAKEP